MFFLSTGRTNETWQTVIHLAVSSHHRYELFLPVLWDHRLIKSLIDPHSKTVFSIFFSVFDSFTDL